MEAGFWGLKSPAGERSVTAALFGAPGSFFRDILAASRYVELYDEKLGFEPWRRGVRTAVVPAGALGRRLGKAKTFCCLIGHSSAVPALLERAPSRILLSPVLAAPEGLDLHRGDLVIGLRVDSPPSAAGGTRWVGAHEALTAGAKKIFGRTAPSETVIIIDPLVMDPSLLNLRRNVEPGGLTWYPLTGLLEECFLRSVVRGVHILPRVLPRKDVYPAFVLARLVTRILALALADRSGR